MKCMNRKCKYEYFDECQLAEIIIGEDGVCMNAEFKLAKVISISERKSENNEES